MSLLTLRSALKRASSNKRAEANRWFFKTGKGQYGEGDRFIGVSMPDIRRIVKPHRELALADVKRLLDSPIHEERMAGVVILTEQYPANPDTIYRFYLKHARRVNNWDLVDVSAPRIVGMHLLHRSRKRLHALARSKNLWERRIAIVSTFALIRKGDVSDTLRIATVLLTDTHDLTHKATGWMLREVGKQDIMALRRFLRLQAHHMPRTMLRYAIERMSDTERKRWMSQKK